MAADRMRRFVDDTRRAVNGIRAPFLHAGSVDVASFVLENISASVLLTLPIEAAIQP